MDPNGCLESGLLERPGSFGALPCPGARGVDRAALPPFSLAMASERSAALTRRQQIVDLLVQQEYGFEGLRAELRLSVRALEDDLHHVERTLHRGERRLVVRPASCWACGYLFKGRAPKHFHTPSRCPRCKSEDIADAHLRITGRER